MKRSKKLKSVTPKYLWMDLNVFTSPGDKQFLTTPIYSCFPISMQGMIETGNGKKGR